MECSFLEPTFINLAFKSSITVFSCLFTVFYLKEFVLVGERLSSPHFCSAFNPPMKKNRKELREHGRPKDSCTLCVQSLTAVNY